MFIFLTTLGLAAAGEPTAEVAAPLHAWVDATTQRDAIKLEAAFLPEAVQVVRVGDKVMALPLDAYKGLITAGKVGGEPLALDVTSIAVDGDVATVQATRASSTHIFHDAVSLLRSEAGWRIAGVAVVMAPRAD